MRPTHPFDLGNLVLPSLELLAEAQMVVSMRLAGLMGVWPVGRDETHRMISEKGPALIGAASDAHGAAMAGRRLDEIMIAAITPLTDTARENRVRLSTRGT
jgi:hypothetical protein